MADEPTQDTAAAADDDPTAVNQGATGERPDGETDHFAERPEAFVGAAFAGGFALAMILRRFAR